MCFTICLNDTCRLFSIEKIIVISGSGIAYYFLVFPVSGFVFPILDLIKMYPSSIVYGISYTRKV